MRVTIPRALLRFAPQAESMRPIALGPAAPEVPLLRVRRCARVPRQRMLDGASRPRFSQALHAGSLQPSFSSLLFETK